MQIAQFNGGLNTVINPSLIQFSEAREFNNIDISSGVLKSSAEDTKLLDAVTSNLYWFNNLWLHTSSATNRSYVEYVGNIYYSSGAGIPQKSFDGLDWYNLGILKPFTMPTLGTLITGALNGTYQFCYTYYNSVDGSESMPSLYTADVVLATQGITLGVVASLDAQVDKIRIYRIGGNLTAMSLDIEVANVTGNYNLIADDASILGNVLESYTYGQAPTNLMHLTEANAMLFGALGNELHFTEIAKVDAWNPFNTISFDADITGIGSMQNGLLVFTRYKTYIVTGNSPETLSRYLLNGSQGCICHRTIGYIDNNLIWLSTDGICTSNGGDIVVESKGKLGKLKVVGPVVAMVHDSVYYLAHATGIIALDTFHKAIITYDTVLDSFAIKEDELYYSHNNELYKAFSSVVASSLTYHSPDFSEGSLSNLKTYKSVYIQKDTGSFEVTIYIDSVEVAKRTISKLVEEIKIPQEYRQGYYISFKIHGQGIIREIEYKVEGRQNGK